MRGFYVEIRHIAHNLWACKSCNARGGQCLGIKQNMHSKSYISLYKLYKEKKKRQKKNNNNNNNNNNDNNKTMPRLTGIQQDGVLHAHVCMR